MANKIALILSLFFVTAFFLFSSDIINLQYIYAQLDSISLNVNYLISKEYGVNTRVLEYVASQGESITIEYSNDVVAIGEPYNYVLVRQFDPLFMNSGAILDVSIKRSVIIGYYN